MGSPASRLDGRHVAVQWGLLLDNAFVVPLGMLRGVATSTTVPWGPGAVVRAGQDFVGR